MMKSKYQGRKRTGNLGLQALELPGLHTGNLGRVDPIERHSDPYLLQQ